MARKRRKARRRRNPVTLTGSGVGMLALLAIGGVAFYFISRRALDAAEKIKETGYNLVAPGGVSPLANPVSEWFGRLFKSDAEKAVDAMLQQPTVRLPTGYDGTRYTGGH